MSRLQRSVRILVQLNSIRRCRTGNEIEQRMERELEDRLDAIDCAGGFDRQRTQAYGDPVPVFGDHS